MHGKKASLLFCSYSNSVFQQGVYGSGNALGPSTSSSPHSTQCQYAQARRQRRHLHTTGFRKVDAHDRGSGPDVAVDASLTWPETGHPSRLPTPYQIFNLEPSAPYSKRRFYDLVKLYHPDRTSTSCSSSDDDMATLPHGERVSRHDLLERYRLVIAAHDILSNHDRRAAYDRTGYGWSLVRESHTPGATAAGAKGFWSTVHRWRSPGPDINDDPMYNATWEDWERWYERRRRREWARYHGQTSGGSGPGYFTAAHGRQQQPVYMNNYIFISLVALVTALAGMAQATRAHEGAKVRIERARTVSEENSKVLMQAREDATTAYSEGEGKRERIRRFLRERDGYDGDLDGRALRADDDALCAPKVVSERAEAPFWKKPPEDR